MRPYYSRAGIELFVGDCREVASALPPESIHAVVTDPPYGLEFMGKDWDAPWKKGAGIGEHNAGFSPGAPAVPGVRGEIKALPSYTGSTNPTCRNCGGTRNGNDRKGRRACRCDKPEFPNTTLPRMRAFQDWFGTVADALYPLLTPGAHLLAFGGDRTIHRIMVAIEDAGFEIRGQLAWLQGQGFPKNLNVSAALEKIVPADVRCACAHRSSQTAPDSLVDCPDRRRSDDARPRGGEDSAQGVAPSPDGALARSRDGLPVGAQASSLASTCPDVDTARPSIADSLRPVEAEGSSGFAGSTPTGTASSTSRASVTESRRTALRTPDTLRLDGDSAASSSSLPHSGYAHLPHCNTCGGVVIPQGLGTALKPAMELICNARKPLSSTVAATVLAHGTGALNVDACRIGTDESTARSSGVNSGVYGADNRRGMIRGGDPAGRWPANVLLDEDVAEGHEWSRFFYVAKASRRERGMGLHSTRTVKYNVSSIGGAALCAETVRLLEKATSDIPTVSWHTGESGVSITGLCHQDSLSTTLTAIRQITASTTSPSLMLSPINESTQDANSETVSGGSPAGHVASSNGLMWISTDGETVSHPSARDVASAVLLRISESDEDWTPLTNIHSTVKPLALMRWLLTLVTPPGGVILDPFAGSGSTLVAAAQLGIRAVGIELSEEYAEIAARRIDHALGEGNAE